MKICAYSAAGGSFGTASPLPAAPRTSTSASSWASDFSAVFGSAAFVFAFNVVRFFAAAGAKREAAADGSFGPPLGGFDDVAAF
mmetsp:Transcript_23723/g.66190  ORF Transcript_23723/g.66190 Transcript_23723/m.66190 type:complete len:84 (+) Transcript_23723:1-252(+)